MSTKNDVKDEKMKIDNKSVESSTQQQIKLARHPKRMPRHILLLIKCYLHENRVVVGVA